MQNWLKGTIACGLTTLFLAGAAIDRSRNMVPPEDVAPYLVRVQEAAAQLPLRMGNWVGENIDVPQAAVRLLRPNVIISRKYTNIVSGRTAEVLLVHCSDSRDLAGHYPPICYPNQGWLMEEVTPMTWRVDDLDVELRGKQYRFRRSRTEDSQVMIRNFMLLPDGTTGPDMDSIHKTASTDRHFYGAGQVQIRTGVGLSEEERIKVVNDLVEAHASVIAAVLAGPHPQTLLSATADDNGNAN